MRRRVAVQKAPVSRPGLFRWWRSARSPLLFHVGAPRFHFFLSILHFLTLFRRQHREHLELDSRIREREIAFGLPEVESKAPEVAASRKDVVLQRLARGLALLDERLQLCRMPIVNGFDLLALRVTQISGINAKSHRAAEASPPASGSAWKAWTAGSTASLPARILRGVRQRGRERKEANGDDDRPYKPPNDSG